MDQLFQFSHKLTLLATLFSPNVVHLSINCINYTHTHKIVGVLLHFDLSQIIDNTIQTMPELHSSGNRNSHKQIYKSLPKI